MLRRILCAYVHVGLVAIGPVVVHAQAGARALTIEDYYRVLDIGAPQMSPDGRWVAFTVSRRIEATNGDSSEVWLVPTTGSTPARRVSPPGTHANAPQWQDDGRLEFLSGRRRLFVRPASPDTISESPSVRPQGGRFGSDGDRTLRSPDGQRVAVVRNVAVPRRDRTFASDFEKRHEERFRGVQFDWLDFQRDGQPFPVPNRTDPQVNPSQEIFLAPNDGGAERQLTRLALRPAGTAWSPDGSRLVFTADSNYRDERKYGASQVYAVGVDG